MSIQVVTGVTSTNPNDSQDRHVMVKLHATGQVVKAVPIFNIEVDSRVETANINIGTEVVMIYDGLDGFYILGSINLSSTLSGEKNTLIENADRIQLKTDGVMDLTGMNGARNAVTNIGADVLNVDSSDVNISTDKLSVTNGTGELVAMISALATACSNAKVDHDGVRSLTQTSKDAILSVKSDIDTFS